MGSAILKVGKDEGYQLKESKTHRPYSIWNH